MLALDLFAGHGWGVACQRLGIEEVGIEIMPEARAIREANGMRTWLADVWDALLTAPLDSPEFQAALQIASPPCQTFSMAGGGAGRKALDEVLALIDDRAYLRPEELRAFGERHDPRTALVLTPLAMVARDAPTFVVWEQVPPVLPVWERAAVEMRRWGYSVWTGILNAEQYGVPQTRRRAVLIARADGVEAAPPVPTHSRYYSRNPAQLDEGVLPWVSMAQALGWDEAERVGFARRADDKGAATEDGYRERDLRPASAPAQHLTEKGRSWRRFAGAGAAAERTAGQIPREGDQPAHTITGKNTHVWLDRPATTVSGDPGIAAPGHHERQMNEATRVTVTEAAALQSYPPDFVWDVMVETERGPKPITKTKQFLTIGNAVPPLLAEAILGVFKEDR